MKNSYNYKIIKLHISLILLLILFSIQLQNTYAQENSKEEKTSKIVRNYFNEKSLPVNNDYINSPAAIKERYFTGFASADYFGYSVSMPEM